LALGALGLAIFLVPTAFAINNNPILKCVPAAVGDKSPVTKRRDSGLDNPEFD